MIQEFERRTDGNATKRLYDQLLPSGQVVRDLIFPEVFGQAQYVGQYSDNSADDIIAFAKRAGITAETRVLDVGCGCCGPAIHISKNLGCRIVGVDISDVHASCAAENVRTAALSDRIEIVKGDIFDVAGSLGTVDVVIGLGAWCHLNPTVFFPLARRLLRPGGRIAFMERIQLAPISEQLLRQLTVDWASPGVESFASYYFALRSAGFSDLFIRDDSRSFRDLQQRFLDVRVKLRKSIEDIAGAEYYRSDLELVQAEVEAAVSGQLGYGCFVGRA